MSVPREAIGRPGAIALASTIALAGVLYAAAMGLQAIRDRQGPGEGVSARGTLYVRSGAFLQKASLSYRALVADVYWIRAIQHYGDTRQSTDPHKQYDLLYPLLDLTTTLDPRFNIAYRFGSIFLAEPFPNGPGRTDLAVALLEKGLAVQPGKWQYALDAGFVYYWWLRDYRTASTWFDRASRVPGAPWWLRSMAATLLAQGGDRRASRQLWEQILRSADNDWLRTNAQVKLKQLDALDQIDELQGLVRRFTQVTGRTVTGWDTLLSAGWLRGIPVDVNGTPYVFDSSRGEVTVSDTSPLYPLPTGSALTVRPPT